MNIEAIKQSGVRKGLQDEARSILKKIEDKESQYKWYDCEHLAIDLQAIYAELLALSKT